MDFDSILNIYKKTYFNLPRPVRSFLGGIYGSIPLEVRFGKQYKIHKKIIEKFENSDRQFQLDFIFNKTYETLQFAYENIPYYKKAFNEYGFEIKCFKSLEDIKKAPFLTKKIIQNDLKNLYVDKIDKPVIIHTGGSTFTPTKFYVPLNTYRSKERAYTNYIFSMLGYQYRDKTLVLRDKDRSNAKEGIYWDYETVANQLWISPNHLNNKYIRNILNEVWLYKPKYIWGYPSTIIFFINECIKHGINSLQNINGVFLTSELVFPEQFKKIKNFFKCPIISHYGHSEYSSLAFRKEKKNYQFMNSYGLTRIIDNEIISTSFDNFVMPFINYKTKDFIKGKCEYYDGSDVVINVENIEGRLQDFIVTKDGTLRTTMSIGMGHFDDYDYVEAAQYYQDTPGKLTINIQTKYPDKVRVNEIIESLEEFVKHTISFSVNFVEEIEKTPRGKWRTCIQKLDIEKYK